MGDIETIMWNIFRCKYAAMSYSNDGKLNDMVLSLRVTCSGQVNGPWYIKPFWSFLKSKRKVFLSGFAELLGKFVEWDGKLLILASNWALKILVLFDWSQFKASVVLVVTWWLDELNFDEDLRLKTVTPTIF